MNWIDTNQQLPEDGQRVLGFIPNNKIFLPGKSGEFEFREIIILRFCRDFFADGSEKRTKHGAHFWQGEGNSNHYFHDVSHWMPIPSKP